MNRAVCLTVALSAWLGAVCLLPDHRRGATKSHVLRRRPDRCDHGPPTTRVAAPRSRPCPSSRARRNAGRVSSRTASAVMETTVMVSRAVRQVVQPDGYSMWQSNGEVAGQEVPHVHVHLLTRAGGDGLLQIYPTPPEEPPLEAMAPLAPLKNAATRPAYTAMCSCDVGATRWGEQCGTSTPERSRTTATSCSASPWNRPRTSTHCQQTN